MILVVDDHLENGLALARLFKQEGREAFAVSSVPAALSLLSTTRPRVVVLAISGVAGLDDLRHMQSDAAARRIPVIVHADADHGSAGEARLLGAAEYLVAVTPWEQLRATAGRYADAAADEAA